MPTAYNKHINKLRNTAEVLSKKIYEVTEPLAEDTYKQLVKEYDFHSISDFEINTFQVKNLWAYLLIYYVDKLIFYYTDFNSEKSNSVIDSLIETYSRLVYTTLHSTSKIKFPLLSNRVIKLCPTDSFTRGMKKEFITFYKYFEKFMFNFEFKMKNLNEYSGLSEEGVFNNFTTVILNVVNLRFESNLSFTFALELSFHSAIDALELSSFVNEIKKLEV